MSDSKNTNNSSDEINDNNRSDIFRKNDGSTIIEGRKKIYATETPMKLLLPNGNDDGILDKDDLIYVVQKMNKGDKEYFRFMVLKFAETDKQKNIYMGDSNFFRRHFDDKSNVVGEENNDDKEKINYKIPIIVGVGIGTIGYLMAKYFNKNVLAYTLGGLVIGGLAGHYISNINNATNNKDKK